MECTKMILDTYKQVDIITNIYLQQQPFYI